MYCGRSEVNDRTIHNDRPDMIMLDNTIEQAHSVDAAIPNSHNLHSTSPRSYRSIQTWKKSY
jgi:hypothetical protein